MSESKFNVVLTNQLGEGQDKAQVIDNLAKLFKTTPQKIEQIFQKPEMTIKKELPEQQAKKFQLAIHKSGGVCRLDEVSPALDDLPDLSEPVESPGDTQAEIQPFHKVDTEKEDKRVTLGLVYEKPEDSEKQQEAIESVDPENFCPECGTIRASKDSVCLHCNYDPSVKEKINLKKFILPAAAVILIAALGFLFGLPAYNEYAKKNQIIEGFAIAFDVKNKVTEFIERTNFWPNQNIDASLPKKIGNDVIESVVVGDNAVITATLHPSILGKTGQTIIFTPRVLKGRVIWNCHKGTLEARYRPEVCIEQAVVID